MTTPAYPIDDAIASARGAAASLASIATQLAEAVSEPAPTPGALKHLALTVQAIGQRAGLAAMSVAAYSGQLTGYAHAAALEAEAEARRHAAARMEVESEAARDATLYAEDTAPGREPLEAWAAQAFAGQWEDLWHAGLGDVPRELAEAWYAAAFARAVKAGGAS
jgi:hypothetical protein